MAPKNFKTMLKNNRSEPAGPEADNWGYQGILRDRLEKAAEQLPVEMIKIEELQDNAYQHLARANQDAAVQDEKLEELAESIRTNGFYGALLARRTPTGGYQLAYGHRRREAARRAGLTELPVKLMELSDEQMARIMASENFSREDLTPIGEANVIGHLYDNLNMTVKDISSATGKGKGWIQSRLDLHAAPSYVKQMVVDRPDSLSFIPVLMSEPDTGVRQTLAGEVVTKGLTREQLRTRVEPKRSGNIVTKNTKSMPSENSEISNNVDGDLVADLDQLALIIGRIEDKVKKRRKPLNVQEISLLLNMTERLKRLK